jgi:hypothetical protein
MPSGRCFSQARDRARAKDAGFDAHFVKPVDLDAILRAFGTTNTTPASR